MKDIKEFPVEVIEKIRFYVYRLIDPRNGETFYVGKGKGNRVFQHINDTLSKSDVDADSDKLTRIREILNSGLKIIHIIHRHGMDEKTAIEVEAALIDLFPSASNIQGGSGSNDYGPMHSFEILNKYSAEEAIFEDKVLMITVNRSITEKSLYDAVRYAWRLSESKIKKVEYVLAVEKGIIKGVYKPIKWLKATPENFPDMGNKLRPDRIGFIGEEAKSDIKNKYIFKRIPDEFRKKGAANPIKYSF
ncbi:MAG: hypothetical protein H7A25_13765 [Leptospiraceae bacterium]|nr:hypothetical protein [Leptospiraceae bacterium]